MNSDNQLKLNDLEGSIQEVMVTLAGKHPTQFIGWCHIELENEMNMEAWKHIFKHRLIMASYNTSSENFIDARIGYVEDTPFINVNKKCEYPTWLMSSNIGGIHASVITSFSELTKQKVSFDFFINLVAKIGMQKGLICYSNPQLVKKNLLHSTINMPKITTVELLWFIKSTYRFRWVFLFVFNNFVYQNKLHIASFLRVLFKKKIKNTGKLTPLSVSSKNVNESINVLIPTLGREKYLFNVLTDLAKQTKLPAKVIIVEQNAIKGAVSKLDFLSEKWPFKIDHTLIYQLGACNARNIGLSKVTSDWVFFADDDIRIDSLFLQKTINYNHSYKADVVSVSCLQEGETEKSNHITQSATFGSGTSIVKSSALKNIKFDMAYEFGYGEDADFGMQLRNNGVDILKVPKVSMLHLKAPIGGFRKKYINKWDNESIQPKPSPTIMVFKLKHATKEQFEGYKTILFFKFYKLQPIKNPFKYYKEMNKRWNKSIFWANRLIHKN